MHDSKDCRVYLDTASTPIIERCQGLVFDGYPDLFNPSLKSNVSFSRLTSGFRSFPDVFGLSSGYGGETTDFIRSGFRSPFCNDRETKSELEIRHGGRPGRVDTAEYN